ncbi:MAG: response regulator [Candidatus Yonathbacteria bacterium]|nr:response regulator [Candidatus Yonathbacteria bacterium]
MEPTATLTPKTVLLVEDDHALNRAVMFKLEQKGHRVISVLRAEDALEALRSEYGNIDIIWLDLLLPGMNGIEFLAEISKHEDYKNLKVVICSVSGREESKELARELGVLDYLMKGDYEIDALVDKVLSYA